MNYNSEKMYTDVLVIGSGAAACMAALEASKSGVKVLIVDKGRLTRSGSTVTAGAGTAAAFGHTELGKKGNSDTPYQHWEDTVKKGRYISNQDLVKYLTEDITEIVDYLVDIGVPYVKTEEGLYYQNQGVGQTYPRNCTPKGNGAALTEIISKEFCYRGVSYLERTRIVKLLTKDNRVIGAIGINATEGKIYMISAKAVIIAAGSATGLQGFASASFKTEGDSYWLAHNAGASLANMEFLEFTFIPMINGRAMPCGGSTQITSRGAKFYNQLGERFMEKYNPDTLERTTRAVLVDAFYREMKEGRGPVYMDCASIAYELWIEWEKIGHSFINFVKAANVDYLKDKIELVPALHCFIGGIIIDASGKTNVEGLFAAGEASTGVQGAVRLGGSSIAECLVYGKRAGLKASMEAINNQRVDIEESHLKNDWESLLGGTAKTDITNAKDWPEIIRKTAWNSLGVIRNEEEIKKGIATFSEIYNSTQDLKVSSLAELDFKISLRNLSFTGILCCLSAEERRESRGHHQREDYPQESNDYLVWNVFHAKNGITCSQEPIIFREGWLKPNS